MTVCFPDERAGLRLCVFRTHEGSAASADHLEYLRRRQGVSFFFAFMKIKFTLFINLSVIEYDSIFVAGELLYFYEIINLLV